MFTAAERRLAWKASLAEGALTSLGKTFTAGPFLVPLLLFLGANHWQIGLLAAILPFAMVASALLDRLALPRKTVAVWGLALGRYAWLPIVALILLPLPTLWRVAGVIVLYALSELLVQTANLAWTDWIGDLLPAHERGRFFGWRTNLMALTGMLGVWLQGQWLDHHKALGDAGWGFASLILTGIACALAARWAMAHQPDHALPPGTSDLPPLETPLPWRQFVAFIGIWSLMVGLAGPFYFTYALEGLKMSYHQLGLWTLAGTVTSLAVQPLWGEWLDRGHRKWLFPLSGLAVSLLPLLWLAAKPDFLLPIWIDGIGNGLAWSAFSLCQTHLLLDLCPTAKRRRHVGSYTLVLGLTSGLSALLGGWLVTWHGPTFLFLLTSLGRLSCWLMLVWLLQRWHPGPLTAASA